ncbi:MAG: ribose-5-phosphate isomerase [Bacteroidetes bacterium HGW-Bacteroidetes-1]|nr:MAG: ribose-5-phosphate isomerase [Bacteroidetes bacterium HGW-Bacteroidetes-1]
MKIGIASDHGGFEIKQQLKQILSKLNYKAVAKGEVQRGIAVCGSGVGASIAANKVDGARAALVHDNFAAHQGVEDDDMNILCLGGRIIGIEKANELVLTFLNAKFSNAERHLRRLRKISHAENYTSEYYF